MDNNLIFVGGIHGVGKTTLCKKLTEELHFNHYSASQLIKMLKSENGDGDNKNKGVKNIDGNQDLLITAINQYLDKNTPTLLDGHFCLLNTEHNVKRIPKETFTAISPNAIITLHDDIANIIKRITHRDGINYDLTSLSSFQDEELSYSADIANNLEIPYLIFNVSDNITGLINFITNIAGREES